jgi:hypothetical protein
VLGRYVRDYCLKDKTSFQLIDLNMKVYASLPPRKLAHIYGWRESGAAALKKAFQEAK